MAVDVVDGLEDGPAGRRVNRIPFHGQVLGQRVLGVRIEGRAVLAQDLRGQFCKEKRSY